MHAFLSKQSWKYGRRRLATGRQCPFESPSLLHMFFLAVKREGPIGIMYNINKFQSRIRICSVRWDNVYILFLTPTALNVQCYDKSLDVKISRNYLERLYSKLSFFLFFCCFFRGLLFLQLQRQVILTTCVRTLKGSPPRQRSFDEILLDM